MAPVTRRQKKALAAAPPPPPGIDRISKLPEDIQAHILSFLPAQEAVRTCVLARTWRHVWKFTRRLLITGRAVEEVREFVDHLLHVRRGGLELASLDASEIRIDPFFELELDPSASEMSSIERWIRRLLKCQIQTLRVDISRSFDVYVEICETPLLDSRHLTRLELRGVWFICRCLDLDGCPALEHLVINECCLEDVRKITSQSSLKRLVITSCESAYADNRIQICVPRLVSLRLDKNDVRTPILERMPELVGAKVQIGSSRDWCDCDDPVACYHVTRDGDTSDNDSDCDDHEEGSGDYTGKCTTKCMVLEGLAQARDLVLIADDGPTYIFRRDLRWCPTFSKLKTLVLIEKYRDEPADCSVAECMLEHAPLLEKFTLILKKVPRGGKYKMEIKGYPDGKVKSTKISQHLQIVEIICEDVNAIFVNLLNFLATLNICFETRVTKK